MITLTFDEVKKLSEGQELLGYEKNELIKELAYIIIKLDFNNRLEVIKEGLNVYSIRLNDVEDAEAEDVADGLDRLRDEVDELLEDSYNVLQ